MKKTMVNETHVEGLLYEHSLERKISGENSKHPGTEFIAGNLSVATDDAGLNIVSVHYTYVTAITSTGKKNQSFDTLASIVDGKLKTVMADGKENAAKVKIDSAIDLNEWFDQDDKLISVKRNEGGFIHLIDAVNPDEKERNTFKTDMVITSAVRFEADEEKNLPEKVVIKGCIFNFRKSLLPVDFSVLNANAMNYFEGLAPSSKEPVFTKVWGRQESQTVTKTTVEESAFGEADVKTTISTKKDFVITGAAKETYTWDDEATLLGSELLKAQEDRNIVLAEKKKRQDEYKASKATGTASFSNVQTAGYTF